MCIAELNVSMLPCRHRWYHLVRPCSPSTNLVNCQRKLGIAGWEIKCEFCPFCAGWNLSTCEYRLIGNDQAPAVGGLSPSHSLTTTRRESRRGSLSRSDSNTSITMMAQEKNRAMNARVDAYIRVPPPPETSSMPAPLQEEDERHVSISTSPSETSSEGQESLRQSSSSSQTDKPSGLMKKMRRKSKRLSLSLFK